MKTSKSKLEILYKDNDVLVINKPAGVIVHPQNENDERESISQILVDAKMVKKDAGDVLRPGIVHRLDKDTSGVLIIARNKKTHHYLVNQFKNRLVQKSYLALVLGKPEHPEGIINSPIGRGKDHKKMALAYEDDGKQAISQYKVLGTYNYGGKYTFSLLEVKIYTGRTHQIRVHLAAIGNPVLGDHEYGSRKTNRFCFKKFGLDRQFLHAEEVKFTLPGKKKIMVSAKLPKELQAVLNDIES
jgi:23S rRNA pseudouridine1911/1915/1917 synthase